MVFMHKTTFDLLQFIPRGDNQDDWFLVDDIIALPIQVLNRKGYFTQFCCSGHPFPDCYQTDPPQDDLYNHDAYIVFREGVSVPMLPLGFDVDAGDENRAFKGLCIRSKEYDYTKEYHTMHEVLDLMEQLYQWALDLPKREEV